MISSRCSVVTVLFARLSTQVRFVFHFLVPPWRREGQNPWDSLSVQHEINLEYARRHWGSLSAFFVKVPPKIDFQSITEEPKYEAKALTVVTDTIKKLGPQCVLVCDFTDNMKVVARGFERKQNCCSPWVNDTTGVKLGLESVSLDSNFCAGII